MAVPTLHSVLILSLLLMSIGIISWISWMKEVVEKSIFRIMPILSEIGGSEELFDLQLRIDTNVQMNKIHKFENLLLIVMGSFITILSLFIIRLLVLFCTLCGNSSCAFLIPCFSGRPAEEILHKFGSKHHINKMDEKVSAKSSSDSVSIEIPLNE